MFRIGGLLIWAAWVSPVLAHESMIFETNAEEDWCAVINETAMPGDIIRLAPGDYTGPCVIARTPPDEQDEYTIVMSRDPDDPARILHDGESSFQLIVEGDQIMLLSLEFGPLPDDVVPVSRLGPLGWLGRLGQLASGLGPMAQSVISATGSEATAGSQLARPVRQLGNWLRLARAGCGLAPFGGSPLAGR